MQQYPVPQFIEEEGKIVFFLSFRQFFLLVGGAAISFLLFLTIPLIFAITLSLLIMAFFSAIAFLKINGVSIIKVVLNFLGFLAQNKNYTWRRKDVPYQPKIQKPQIEELKVEKKPSITTQTTSKLENVKKMIETKK